MDSSNHFFHPFRIGFDWHRTTVNIGPAIQRIARRKFNVLIPEDQTRGRYAIDRFLSRKDFETILDIVITKASYITRNVHETPYAFETISLLKSEGHFVEIVSSSSHEAHIAILRKLIHHQFSIATRSLGRYEKKGSIAKDYDVFLDDTPEQAEELSSHGTPFVYLLETPTNQGITTSEQITRVPDLRAFYRHVKELHQRLYPDCYPRKSPT